MTQLTFTEFEAFAEAVKEASMTMRITALEQRRWTLRYEIAGSLRLQQGYEGGGSIAEGVTLSDGWTFYNQPHPVFANGQVVTGDEVFTAPPRSQFCLACQPSHEWLTLFVPTTLLFPSSQELECISAAKPHVLKPPPQVTGRFTSLMRRFLLAAENHPQLISSPVALNCFETELLAATEELFTKNQPSPNRNFGYFWRAVRTQPTVTQIAFGLGFWDLGRFAGAYRQLFGERPSKTLRKCVLS